MEFFASGFLLPAAAAAALISGIFSLTSLLVSKENKVSEYREQWLQRFREEAGDVLATIETLVRLAEARLLVGPTAAAQTQISRFRRQHRELYAKLNESFFRLLLRLNVRDQDPMRRRAMQELEASLRNIYLAFYDLKDASQIEHIRDLQSRLVEQTREVVKQTWDRVRQGEQAFRLMKVALVAGVGLLVLLLAFLWHRTPAPMLRQATQEVRCVMATCQPTDVADTKPRPPATAPVDERQGDRAQPAGTVQGTSSLSWPAGLLGALVLLGAGALLMGIERPLTKSVGAVSLLAGLSLGGFTLVKDVKVDSVFKLDELKIDSLIKASVSVSSASAPTLLATFEGFPLGEAHLDANSEVFRRSIDTILRDWRAARAAGHSPTLMLVGATDRVPLTGATRHRFESNAGLARARAETIRAALIEAAASLPKDVAMPETSFLVVVSGPQTTPELTSANQTDLPVGYPKDRRVEVWMFRDATALRLSGSPRKESR